MATHYKGSKAAVRALNAFITLMRASDAFAIYLQSDLGNRLTLSQFGVLEALLHRGPLYQGDLASKLLRSCGSITAVVAGLEKHGLVERQRMEEDRRFVRVSLTENGRKLISKIFPEHVKIITQQFRVLTVEEQEELRRLCRKLGTFIGKG